MHRQDPTQKPLTGQIILNIALAALYRPRTVPMMNHSSNSQHPNAIRISRRFNDIRNTTVRTRHTLQNLNATSRSRVVCWREVAGNFGGVIADGEPFPKG